jgi:steroid 5-alpha reductase family enzyme
LESSHIDSASAAAFEVWNNVDTLAAGLFTGLLLMETIADQQQWNFQQKK